MDRELSIYNLIIETYKGVSRKELPKPFLCKKYIKENKPQNLVSTLSQEEAIRLYQDTTTDENDIKSSWKLARKLRGEILQSINFLVILTVLNLQYC